jgi:hypothetical protein
MLRPHRPGDVHGLGNMAPGLFSARFSLSLLGRRRLYKLLSNSVTCKECHCQTFPEGLGGKRADNGFQL